MFKHAFVTVEQEAVAKEIAHVNVFILLGVEANFLD
jgi:hypothetical protein